MGVGADEDVMSSVRRNNNGPCRVATTVIAAAEQNDRSYTVPAFLFEG